MTDAQEKFESTTLQEAYADRNLAVMVLARLAEELGFHVGLKDNPDDPDWPVLFVELPLYRNNQVSWHLPKAEIIGQWLEYDGDWDGHSLEEKQKRMKTYLMAVART